MVKQISLKCWNPWNLQNLEFIIAFHKLSRYYRGYGGGTSFRPGKVDLQLNVTTHMIFEEPNNNFIFIIMWFLSCVTFWIVQQCNRSLIRACDLPILKLYITAFSLACDMYSAYSSYIFAVFLRSEIRKVFNFCNCCHLLIWCLV